MRLRIHLFTLIRIRIRIWLFTLMKIRIRILLIKVMRTCDHWSTDPLGQFWASASLLLATTGSILSLKSFWILTSMLIRIQIQLFAQMRTRIRILNPAHLLPFLPATRLVPQIPTQLLIFDPTFLLEILQIYCHPFAGSCSIRISILSVNRGLLKSSINLFLCENNLVPNWRKLNYWQDCVVSASFSPDPCLWPADSDQHPFQPKMYN